MDEPLIQGQLLLKVQCLIVLTISPHPRSFYATGRIIFQNVLQLYDVYGTILR